MACLKGKKALVTAGGQGLGKAICMELIARGCHVAAHYRSSEEGAMECVEAARAAGLKAIAVQGDLTCEADARRVVEEAAEALGGLDILVNNTGDLVGRRRLDEIDLEFWQRVIDVNLKTMLLVTQAALPYLKAPGAASIVNMASLAGRKGGHPGSLAYSSSKGAVLTWTRALSAELAPLGIRVNALAPGFIAGSSFHATHTTEESARQTVAGIPLGRAGTPEDVARAAAFLASELDGFITGATLDVNGGVYCA